MRMYVESAFGTLKGIWRVMLNQAEVFLRNMSNIIATKIVLHNLCIINNKGIENEWIEAKNKLAKEVGKGEIQEGNKFQGKKVRFVEVKIMILAMRIVLIADVVNDVVIYQFLLIENQKTNDLSIKFR